MEVPPQTPDQRFLRHRSLEYLSYRLAHLFARALDDRLARYGVSVGQFRLLLVLWEGGRFTQVEMARLLDIEQPTVAATLRRMQRDGLIRIETDPQDGRRRLVSLTERGVNLRVPLTAEAQIVNEQAVDGMSPPEVDGLLDELTRVLDRLYGISAVGPQRLPGD